MKTLVAALGLTVALLAAPGARAADPITVPIANIPTVEEADNYARELIARIKAENEAHPELAADPIMIMHVGRSLPAPLKWIIVHLDRAHIPYEIDLVTPEQMTASMDDAAAHALESTSILDYGEGSDKDNEVKQRSIKTVAEKAKLMVDRVFGWPNGFSMWVKLKRTSSEKRLEGGTALIQSVISGVSLGFSLYLSAAHGGPSAHILPAVGAMIAWITANAYWGRGIAEWINQGRGVTEVKKGQFSVRKAPPFFWLSQIIRSQLGNAIVVGSAFGLEGLLSGSGWIKSTENSMINLVARSWVDQWIYGHQATTNPDGTVTVQDGQWSPKKTIVVALVWNVLYGLVKSLDLLGIIPFHGVYLTMGVVGAAKLVYDERYWIKHKWEKLVDVIRGAAHDECQSLLIRKSAVRPLLAPLPEPVLSAQ